MTDDARNKRNASKLRECNPVFAMRVSRILGRLEADGFRPRIQEAYRSRSDQLAAFQRGASRVKVGFHNMTTPDGKPDALAVDVLDDNAPLSPGTRYVLALAWAAKCELCATGIDWGLLQPQRNAIAAAIEAKQLDADVRVGWDPCHVQPADVPLDAALQGRRPS